MTRDEAYQLLIKYLHNKNLIKHCLASEAAMKAIYRHTTDGLQRTTDEKEKWGITGLLHDVDYELAQQTNQLDKHGLLIFDPSALLRQTQDRGLRAGYEPVTIPDDIAHAIKAHNFENTHVMPENRMDWAIACCDQLTGLIVSAALIHPDKKLAAITPDFVLKRFGEKAFSKGVSREAIQRCEEKLNIPLKDFVTITLQAMQEIHQELGL